MSKLIAVPFSRITNRYSGFGLPIESYVHYKANMTKEALFDLTCHYLSVQVYKKAPQFLNDPQVIEFHHTTNCIEGWWIIEKDVYEKLVSKQLPYEPTHEPQNNFHYHLLKVLIERFSVQQIFK